MRIKSSSKKGEHLTNAAFYIGGRRLSCNVPKCVRGYRGAHQRGAITLIAGRGFEDRDDETAAPVAVVNNTLAERFWVGAPNAIGKRIRAGDGDWRTVIGVAADVKYLRINEAPRSTPNCRFCTPGRCPNRPAGR